MTVKRTLKRPTLAKTCVGSLLVEIGVASPKSHKILLVAPSVRFVKLTASGGSPLNFEATKLAVGSDPSARARFNRPPVLHFPFRSGKTSTVASNRAMI